MLRRKKIRSRSDGYGGRSRIYGLNSRIKTDQGGQAAELTVRRSSASLSSPPRLRAITYKMMPMFLASLADL
jgi:hypothetical protein